MAERDLTPEIDEALAQMDRLLAAFSAKKPGPPKTDRTTRMAFRAISEQALNLESGEHQQPQLAKITRKRA